MPGRPHPALLVALLLLLSPVVAPPPAGAAPGPLRPVAEPSPPRPAGPSRYRPPVAAPVADPFREPASRYGAGNRGLEYATTPGAAVGAIGPGVVLFAGAVAGARWVTVAHPDGLRSSVGPLVTMTVAVGDRVVVGQRLGTAASRLHLGVRRGDRYLDPATLFRHRRPRLVPTATVGRSTTARRS